MKLYMCVFLLLFQSCNKDAETTLPKVPVQCTIKGVSTFIEYSSNKIQNEKSIIPCFISGVKLTVENLEFNVSDVVSDFYFEKHGKVSGSEGEKFDIVLNNVTVGSNRIKAKGICEHEPINSVYSNIMKCNAKSLNDRAAQYCDILKKLHPIFADYYNEKDIVKKISKDSNKNVVDISMITDSHRLAVVIENLKESKYLLKAHIEGAEGNVLLSSDDFINIGSQSALIVNNKDSKGEKTYRVIIQPFTKSKLVIGEPVVRTLNIGKSNFTKLFVFSSDELLESSSNLYFGWKYMEDTSTGSLIGD